MKIRADRDVNALFVVVYAQHISKRSSLIPELLDFKLQVTFCVLYCKLGKHSQHHK